MNQIEIVLPPRLQDELSSELRKLTAACCEAVPELETGFGLGGEHGYGVNFENDVFEMRRFNWGECDCGFADAEDEFSAQYGHKDVPWGDFKETGHKPTCSFELPNFRHKATGFEVRWYKWIGRDNVVSGPEVDIHQLISECIVSLPERGAQP